MSRSVALKKIFKRCLVLFAVFMGVTVVAAFILWWHHISLAERCTRHILRNGEPVTCSYSTTFFADGLSWGILALVYLVICIAVASIWGWAKHRSMRRTR